jgi:hypothetical protein
MGRLTAAESTPSQKKTKVTNASAMFPRKNCAAQFRKFSVWLRIIRAAFRVSRSTKIRSFCRKIANPFAAPAAAMGRGSPDEIAQGQQPPGLGEASLQHSSVAGQLDQRAQGKAPQTYV